MRRLLLGFPWRPSEDAQRMLDNAGSVCSGDGEKDAGGLGGLNI